MIAMTQPRKKLDISTGASLPGYHAPVLLAEVLSALQPGEGKLYVDGTLGGGGHSEALLAAGARVIGIDQDPEALRYATDRLARFSDRFTAVHGSFANVGELLDGMRIGSIDGALLDIGVSSHQLDTAARGFSFQAEGPLDMRMDPTGLITAADLLNTMSAEQLERIFRQYGEEPAARKIAARLVRDRLVSPFTTTLELADAVSQVVPRRGKAHPATRVFQALRIVVNRELDVLRTGLDGIAARLVSGGRFAVITFHSLEDRIAKQYFKSHCNETVDRPEWPAPRPNPDCIFRKITGKAVIASLVEQRTNPRSRSAKLRAVEKL